MTYRLRPNTERYQTYIEQSTHTLANSLFLIYFLFLLVFAVSAFVLIQSDMLQLNISVAVSGVVLLIPALWVFNKLLRTDPSKWFNLSRRIVWTLTNPIIHFVLTASVLQLFVFGIQFDQKFTVANTNVDVVFYLVGAWLVIVWMITSYPLWRSTLEHPVWILTSFAVLWLVILFGISDANATLLRSLNREQSIQVSIQHDLRRNDSVDRETFWREYHSIRRPLIPYLGHRSAVATGDYFNVDAQGIRKTLDLAPLTDAQGQVAIHFYGGSTMWGYGARDEYTIPSEAVRVLQEEYNYNAKITNFADIGYNSYQDKVLFDAQLLKGNIPDIAVFYQGYNDLILGIATAQSLGAPAETAPLVSIPIPNVTDYSDYYLRYLNTLQATASAHDIHLIVVWQPMWIHKTLTDDEQHAIINLSHADPQLVEDTYRLIESQIATIASETQVENFLDYYPLFDNYPETIFTDVVHINEHGNRYVAEHIVNYIVENILKTDNEE